MASSSPKQGPSASDPRWIEFLGLPGSGKTTLAPMVADTAGMTTIRGLIDRERLRPRGLLRHQLAMRFIPRSVLVRVLTGPTPNAKDAAEFLLEHRELHQSILDAFDAAPETSERVLGVQLLFESAAQYRFAEQVGRPGDAVLVHEGILQRAAFLLALSVGDAEQTRQALLKSLPPLDGVIFLDVPLKVAIDRVVRRGREFTATDVMWHMEQTIAVIVSHLRTVGVPMLTVRGDRPPAEAVPEVMSFLRPNLPGEDRTTA